MIIRDKVKFTTIHPEEGYPIKICGTIIQDTFMFW